MNTFEERPALHQFPSPKSNPWIFYSHGEGKREHTVYSLSEGSVHNEHIKEMVDNDIMCSWHGWLVLINQIDPRICQLFNPVSGATIQLPLLTEPRYGLCALSCDPNNPNCIVMLINPEADMATYYFCKPGDVVWTEKDLAFEEKEICSNYYPDCLCTVGCYKGQICMLTRFDKILLLAANPPYLTLTDLGVEHIPDNIFHYGKLKKYLVESDGELFVIRRYYLRIDAYYFFVYKLDISEKKKRLVAVENLGGRSLFLSTSGAQLMRFSENHGIKANTIYFTEPSDPRIFSFDLQKKVLTFSLPCPNVERNLVQAEWILPLSPPCKLDCKVDVIAPLQFKKSTMLQSSIGKSIGKDWPQDHNDISNSVAEGDWSKLPNDVLISIAEKLSCVSSARIATVCRSWESAITWAPKKLNSCPTFLHTSSSSIEVFHFMNKSIYNVPVRENPEVLNIQHANHGWLLMTKYGGMEIFFINPLTEEKINIPYLPDAIRGCCFTSFPTSSRCSILCISHSSVYHIHRGERKWTEVEIPEFESIVGDFELTPYSNPVFHKGLFYWIWGCGNLCIYDSTKEKVEFLGEPRSPYMAMCISYLFESGEKLMSVWAERHGKCVRIFELDEACMTWKEVNTLDKKMIFLSRNSSIVTEIQGLKDMICFNRFVDDNQPLIYSLKSGKFEVYGGEDHDIQDFCDIPEYQIKSTWIQPNVKEHSPRALNWYDVVFNISKLFVTD